MGNLEISDELRQKRSENMRRLHAEGRAGGKEFGKLGGRPKKQRASELIAEEVSKDAKRIYQEIKNLAFEDESSKIRLDAIFKMLAIEEQERKIEVEEEVRYEQLKHGDLAELVIGNLFELLRTGQVDLGEIIDAEIIEERTVDAIGEGN